MQPPCKDCPDRFLGCHSTCEKYIAYDKYRKEMLAKRAEQNRLTYGYLNSNRFNKKKRKVNKCENCIYDTCDGSEGERSGCR